MTEFLPSVQLFTEARLQDIYSMDTSSIPMRELLTWKKDYMERSQAENLLNSC